MTIATPKLELARPLLENIEAVCARQGITIRTCSLEECGELLNNNLVQAALVSPQGYGMGVGKVDFRIVPGPCLALQDFTNTYGASFAEGRAELSTFYAPEPTSFMSRMMRMIMSEKFDVAMQSVAVADDADCRMGPPISGTSHTLDLGEEWFDIAEAPLPLALWVVRVDSEIEAFDQLVRDAAGGPIAEKPVSELPSTHSDHTPREGTILYQWSDAVEEGLVATLNALYFHQSLPEIPAVKVYGRD